MNVNMTNTLFYYMPIFFYINKLFILKFNVT
jgi:hypothetical protein